MTPNSSLPARFGEWPPEQQREYLNHYERRAEIIARAASRAGVEMDESRLNGDLRVRKNEATRLFLALYRAQEDG
jgi:hypothetical protein